MTLRKFRRRALEIGLAETEELCSFCLTRPADTRDHFIPKSRWREYMGNAAKLRSATMNNTVPACGHCNRTKGNLRLHEWLGKLSQKFRRYLPTRAEKAAAYAVRNPRPRREREPQPVGIGRAIMPGDARLTAVYYGASRPTYSEIVKAAKARAGVVK